MEELRRKIFGRVYIAYVDEDEYLTPREVSFVLRVGLRHVYRLLNENKLKCKKFGTNRRVKCVDAIGYRLRRSFKQYD